MSELEYPWQQIVFDALGAGAETLPAKIKVAEKVIAARLRDPQQPDAFERLAITGALRVLEKLLEAEPVYAHPPINHYHIRWTSNALDWERFNTRADAEAAAEQLALPGETYTIEEHGDECPRCRALMKERQTCA